MIILILTMLVSDLGDVLYDAVCLLLSPACILSPCYLICLFLLSILWSSAICLFSDPSPEKLVSAGSYMFPVWYEGEEEKIQDEEYEDEDEGSSSIPSVVSYGFPSFVIFCFYLFTFSFYSLFNHLFATFISLSSAIWFITPPPPPLSPNVVSFHMTVHPFHFYHFYFYHASFYSLFLSE